MKPTLYAKRTHNVTIVLISKPKKLLEELALPDYSIGPMVERNHE